ncbi:hypothetical protein ABBQ38_011686 [Trebouxia sp. C0009 RCD-2024]
MNQSRPAPTEAARTDVLQECQGLVSGIGFWHKLLALPAARLLRAVAPHLAAWLLHACALQHAEYTLVKLLDGRQYLLKVHRLSLEQKSTRQSRLELGNNTASISGQLRGFQLFLKLYVYNPQTDSFDPVPGMPDHLPQQICQALQSLQQIETAGANWQMFNLAQKQRRKDMLHVYGDKKRLVPPKSFYLAEPKRKAVLAIFLIQILEEIYLVYRGRYFYPVLICAFSFPAVVGLAALLSQQHKKVMALMNQVRLTPMVQGQWVRATSSHRLVPGDVIVLHSGRALCDMVLLRGACLVTEATLSGEADQLRKTAFVREEGKVYDPDKHRSCTIYAGTMVQQDILHLYLFALVLQCLIFIPYMIKASQHAQTAKQVFYRLMDVLIFAVPPGLPLVLMLVGAVAQSVLLKAGVLLLRPEIVRPGAVIDMVCFDKTGTLTSNMADLQGVLPVNEAAFGGLETTAFRWGGRLRQMFAVCHSLNMVSRSLVAGADLERKLFKAVEASFLDRETILLPHPRRSPRMLKLSIVRVLEFTSQTLRSGAVVLSEDAPANSALLFLRGAPAVIKRLVKPATVPPNFDQVMDKYSSKSFRLLAGAVGIIRNADKLDLVRMPQQQLEAAASHMQLLGLVVLANTVRPDSRETISLVQDG